MLKATSDRPTRERPFGVKSIVRGGVCLLIILSGLALRGFGFGLGLPAFFVKYGGSMLWAAMVFFLVAIAASHRSRRSIASISAVIAVGVELFRLVHAPWLDAFRLTMAGALLLGRIFSPWNRSLMALESFWECCSIVSASGLSQRKGFQRRTPLTPLAETARNGAVLPQCVASAPFLNRARRLRRPSSISASAIFGFCDRF